MIILYDLVAREIARHPERDGASICREYGLFIECMTDDEKDMLQNMIADYLPLD